MPPPPRLIQPLMRGAFASAIVILAGLVPGNAIAQTSTCTAGRIGANPHQDASTIHTHAECQGGFGGDMFVITDLGSNQCGICVAAADCNTAWVRYQVPNSSATFCGPIERCTAEGGAEEGDMFCGASSADPQLIHHQICFNENPETPIARTAFTGTNLAEHCRAATQGDIDICGSLDTTFFNAGHFTRVIDGSCAADLNCSSNTDGQIYAIQPGVSLRAPNGELVIPGVNVGTCTTESLCRGTGGYPDEAANECRLATGSAECRQISEDTPMHDTDAENHCRALEADDCDPHEYVEDNACTECDVNEIRGGDGSCEPCQAGHVRPAEETSCTCRSDYFTGGGSCEPFLDPANDCADNQIVNRAQNVCQDCGDHELRRAGTNECECPQEMHFGTVGNCAARRLPNTCADNQVVNRGTNECADCGDNELRRAGTNECECPNTHFGTVGDCQEITQSNTCGPHEYVEANVCTECGVNEVRGADGACQPCQANHVRPAEETSCACRSDYFTGGGSCVPFIDPADDCEPNQILNRADNSCQDCGEHEVRGADGACDCQQFGEVGDCEAIVEVSTCAPNQHIPENENACAECPANQFRGAGNSSCADCPTNEVRAAEATSCSCPSETHYKAGEGEPCVPHVRCGQGEVRRESDNTCAASCLANEDLVNGECQCRGSQIRVNNAGECVDRVACSGGEVTAANVCQCPDNQEDISGTCLQICDPNATRQGTECLCNADYEGDGLSCAACENGQRSEAGGTCDCPNGQMLFIGGCAAPMECGSQVLGLDNTCTDECTGGLLNIGGICEEMRTCQDDSYDYDALTNRCVCPSGERENAAMTACEAIPAASSGGGGGAAAAIIAVPVILIGGYWLLGGFKYVDSVYDFEYSGENGDLDWQGNASFNLRHGGLRSYASAIQSNGDAVSYESGISYERDFISLTYDAAESESEYLYDFGARVNAEFGLWTFAPTASSEFQYRQGVEEWTSNSSAGLSAAWISHKWRVRARSAFAGGGGHAMDLELRF